MKKSKKDYIESGNQVRVMSMSDIAGKSRAMTEALESGEYIKLVKHGRELAMLVPINN